MLGEMDTAAKLHKLYRGDPTAMAAPTVVNMATAGSAAALGLGAEIGSLEPGKRADVIIVDTNAANLVPLYNEFSHLTYAATSANVATVLINGRPVMEDSDLLTIDEERVFAEVRALAKKIGS